MKTLTTGLLGVMLLAGAVQADVFVSRDAKGDFVLSNVHRPGRHYERVVHEAEVAVVSLDQQPQMIAAQTLCRAGLQGGHGQPVAGGAAARGDPDRIRATTPAPYRPRARAG